MASKNTKNKATQTKKVSEVSNSVVNEIMDMEIGGKKTEKVEAVEEPAPVVKEKESVATEEVSTEEKAEETVVEATEPAVEEEVVTEEETAAEEEAKEETECITPGVTAVETEVASIPVPEEPVPLVMPTAEVGPQNPPVENDPSMLKDSEEKKEAPRPRRRTTREVYGYDVSGYNFDL